VSKTTRDMMRYTSTHGTGKKARVMITYDEPKAVEGTFGYATAGWNAAPTAGAVIERIAPMLGVKRTIDPIAMSPFGSEVLP